MILSECKDHIHGLLKTSTRLLLFYSLACIQCALVTTFESPIYEHHHSFRISFRPLVTHDVEQECA